jgi:hypothetical protein
MRAALDSFAWRFLGRHKEVTPAVWYAVRMDLGPYYLGIFKARLSDVWWSFRG